MTRESHTGLHQNGAYPQHGPPSALARGIGTAPPKPMRGGPGVRPLKLHREQPGHWPKHWSASAASRSRGTRFIQATHRSPLPPSTSPQHEHHTDADELTDSAGHWRECTCSRNEVIVPLIVYPINQTIHSSLQQITLPCHFLSVSA